MSGTGRTESSMERASIFCQVDNQKLANGPKVRRCAGLTTNRILRNKLVAIKFDNLLVIMF
jgi:hypothetical protein